MYDCAEFRATRDLPLMCKSMMIRYCFVALVLSIATSVIVPASARAQAPWLKIASNQPAPGTCASGYVWRQVDAADHVCVTPAQRNQDVIENAVAGRTNTDGTCIAGYVWRQAEPTDHVCVTPAQRAQATAQNRAAPSHMLSLAAPKSPGPPPTAPASDSVTSLPGLAPPGLPWRPPSPSGQPPSLATSQNPSDCGSAHETNPVLAFPGPGLCQAALNTGSLLLVWNPLAGATAYHVYRVDGGQHTQVDRRGGDQSYSLLPVPKGGFSGTCYVATDTIGTNPESAASNTVCVGKGTNGVALTATLIPTQLLHWQNLFTLNTSGAYTNSTPANTFDTTPNVGYSLAYTPGDIMGGANFITEYDRTGLLFDLSPFMGRTIANATLQLVAQVSYHSVSGDGNATLGNMNPQVCVTTIDLGTDTWWQNQDLMNTNSYLHFGTYQGPSFSVDVTSAVANWTSAAPENFGFVLKGSYENNAWQGKTNQACMTTLSSEQLIVVYR